MVLRQCFHSGFILVICASLFGCVSTTPPPSSATAIPTPPQNTALAYHYTQKGETLWRIARQYNVGLDELIKLNHISDPAQIESGQLIFIPRLKEAQYKSSLQKDNREDFIWPLKGNVISRFGDKTESVINKGIDIQAPYGKEVVASRSGVVSFCDEKLKNFGRTVIIDHGDGFLTVYARNSNIFVKMGDRVSQGVVIAKVGNAGKDKTTFLHFEIRKGHTPQNPYYYLPK